MATVRNLAMTGRFVDPHIQVGGATVYNLLTNATATGVGVANIQGGDYIWRCEASAWGGATATLQFLGLDGGTWYDVLKSDGVTSVTMTANGSIGVGIGQMSTVRVKVTGGPPTALNSNLAGLA